MKMRSYNFCDTNTKNPGNNLGIFCLITGRPKLNGYVYSITYMRACMELKRLTQKCYFLSFFFKTSFGILTLSPTANERLPLLTASI